MSLPDVKRREHTPAAKHSGPWMARQSPPGMAVLRLCGRRMLPEARTVLILCLPITFLQTKKNLSFQTGFLKSGRRERIRTSDPLVPNQLRYQAALLAEILLFEFLVQFFKVVVRGGGLEPPRP